MSDIIVMRDADIVAAEIRTIQNQARKMALLAAVEVGRRLVEAKEIVAPGQWMKWLEKEVSYSQSTANNLMAIYREYGEKDQESLFGDNNSQAFENLSYTQALALLAVPAEERAEFAEKNNVAEMSTRELQLAIKERDEAKEAAEKAKAGAETLAQQVQKSTAAAAEYKRAAADAASSKEQAQAEVKKLRELLANAQTEAKLAKDQLAEIQEHPEVPDDVMAQIRKEAEESAAKDAEEKAQKQLNEIQRKLELAEEHAALANKNQEAAEANLERVRNEAKMMDPAVAVFQVLFEELQDAMNRVNGHRLKTAATNEHAAEGMKKALTALLKKELDGLQ